MEVETTTLPNSNTVNSETDNTHTTHPHLFKTLPYMLHNRDIGWRGYRWTSCKDILAETSRKELGSSFDYIR